MTFVAALLKWAMENPKLVRAGLTVAAALIVAAWLYHRGSLHAIRIETSKEISTAVHVKEQYDEISNHRPDNSRLLDILRAGKF